MDAFVLLSIYEGFGFVNIETQVSGLPCILSEAVPRKVDISGKVEFLKLDPIVWCDAFEKAYSKKEERVTLETTEYDLSHESRRLEDIYQSLTIIK